MRIGMRAFVTSASVLLASNGPASAGDNVGGVVAGYVDKYMHEAGNRSEVTSASWDHKKYYYAADDLTEADKLNGITLKGTVTLAVPVKTAHSAWIDHQYTFLTIEQNGTLTVSRPDNSVGPLNLDSLNWSCRFKNGRQVQ